jgi:DNA-directed RNA polymerase subunit RPC12/RpoP
MGQEVAAPPSGAMRRRPKPAVVLMRPVPAGYSDRQARCPRCDRDGAEVVGVIVRRLVFRCGRCGTRFHRVVRLVALER